MIYLRLLIRLGILVFFTSLYLTKFRVKKFVATLPFLSKRRLPVVLDGKYSQEYPVNAGVPQDSILGPTLFFLCINGLPDDVTCNITICANDTSLSSNCDQSSNLWQQVQMAAEFKLDLQTL